MEINQRAALVARKEIFIQAKPHDVWNIQSDIDSWKQWHSGIAMSKLDGPLTVGAAFQWKSGGMTINSTIRVLEPNEKIGWTGKAIGTRATHVWTLTPHNDGTLLTTEESMDGWLVKVLKVVMPKFLEESLDVWLQSLKTRAEAGAAE